MVTDTKKPVMPVVKVSPETKKRLDLIGCKNDSYDDIIKRLLDQNENSNNHNRQ